MPYCLERCDPEVGESDEMDLLELIEFCFADLSLNFSSVFDLDLFRASISCSEATSWVPNSSSYSHF